MIAGFINYIPDTIIEEVDDESSSDEMDLEYTAKEHGEIIMLADNRRIHHSDFFIEAINKRGYKPLFLPPYSPFLNLIEECSAKVKKNTRRHQLSMVDQLTPRIAAA